MKLLDHRGFIPQSLLDKTDAAQTALKWVRTGFGGSTGGFGFGHSRIQDIVWGENGECGSVSLGDILHDEGYPQPTTPFDKNTIAGGFQEIDEKMSASIHIDGTSVGSPEAIRSLPDGCTINAAELEITTTSLVYDSWQKTWSEGPNGSIIETSTSTTSVESVGFTLLRQLPGGGVETLTNMPSGNTVNGVTVVNATEAMRAIYTDRNSQSYSYVVFPGTLEGLDLMAMINNLLAPLPTVGILHGGCRITSASGHSTQWGGCTLGRINLSVTYPDHTTRDIVVPRWPVMS